MANDLKVRIHSDDPRLKRQINHDSQSANYRLPTSDLDIVDCDWELVIARLNQGDIGKCTAESATEVLGSQPFYPTLPVGIGEQLDDSWSSLFYSDEEMLDGDGPYPPNDNGSSGLTSAKIAKARKLISGYQHTFTAEDAIKGIQISPGSWGTFWKSGMDNVNTTTGQVKYTGSNRGGHQLSVFKVVSKLEQIWFHNHWGPWGYRYSGDAWISFVDFEKSLADQGDMTFYVPLSQPAPIPAPPAVTNVIRQFTTVQADALDNMANHPHAKAGYLAAAAAAWHGSKIV